MNKNQFVDKIYTRAGLTKKDCKLCLDAILEVIKDALIQGESVTLSNFGKFKVTENKPKQMYNFHTKMTKTIEARRTPAFKASDNLKQSVR